MCNLLALCPGDDCPTQISAPTQAGQALLANAGLEPVWSNIADNPDVISDIVCFSEAPAHPNNLSREGADGCIYTPFSLTENTDATDWNSFDPATGILNLGVPLIAARAGLVGGSAFPPANTWTAGPALTAGFDNATAFGLSMFTGPANGFVCTVDGHFALNLRLIFNDNMPAGLEIGARILRNAVVFQTTEVRTGAVEAGGGVSTNTLTYESTLFGQIGDTFTYEFFTEGGGALINAVFSCYQAGWRTT